MVIGKKKETEMDEWDRCELYNKERKLIDQPFPVFNMRKQWHEYLHRKRNSSIFDKWVISSGGSTSRLQSIIKMSKIVLTPQNPIYEGGQWHIGIAITDENNYTQYQSDALKEFYGIENEGKLINNLGKVTTKAGRSICFPNIYQHQVQPFKLKDMTISGYRRIIAIFVVNPVPLSQSQSYKKEKGVDHLSQKKTTQTPTILLENKNPIVY
jgi:hypothetical protein